MNFPNYNLPSYAKTFVGDLRSSFLDLSLIIGIIAIFQFVVLRTVPPDLPQMLIGLGVVGIGLALFMRGLEMGLFPLGERLAKKLSSNGSRFWIILFAFIIGFATTIAEPALISIAHKAAVISDGQINAFILRLVVALAVGFAIVIGVLRIIFNHPLHWYIIGGYASVLTVTFFAPPEIVGLAYDSGGVTTSTVTVPLIAALGIGLATSLKNRNPLIDGFGLIAFASLTPMFFVQLYGIVAYSLLGSGEVDTLNAVATTVSHSFFVEHTLGFLGTIFDVLPVILTLLFFYYFVLHQKIEHLQKRAFGFLLVLMGLYLFVVGLEVGLFPIGESIAGALASKGNLALVYTFAFSIGFATTLAEPALTAIARKAEEISGGAMRAFMLRMLVAFGVGFGILLGSYRIVEGDPIVWYIMTGYAVVVLMTYFAPRTVISIAYDSGGVTTSTITVPIVAALGLGLASTIPGRDPLIDGFGLIAFASLFPVIAVLGYGIFKQEQIRRYENKLRQLESRTVSRVLDNLKAEAGKAEKHLAFGVQKQTIVTITGDTGSGVSTVAEKVAQKLRYRHFSAGMLFRKIADNHKVSVEDLAFLAEQNEAVDQEIDQLIIEIGQTNGKVVLDARMAYHWIQGAFKVHLQIDEEAAAVRIFEQILEGKRPAQNAESVDEILDSISFQRISKEKRFQSLYGIDITNVRPFHLVIDTDNRDVDSVVTEILDAYKQWQK